MTKDLENTLKELGPEYRSVVDRLHAPFSEADVARPATRPRFSARPYLLAASLLLVLGLAVWNLPSLTSGSACLVPRDSPAPRVYTVAYASDEFALQAILESQQSDGSWSNDYVTMQNAAALRKAHDEASRIAYKRAVRYLRTKGLDPISDTELERRTARAFPAG